MQACSRPFFIPLVFFISLSAAQPPDAWAVSTPQTVTIGVYITSIYDINFTEESFNVVFWLWFKYPQADYDPGKAVEIVNAKEYSLLDSYTKRLPDTYYTACKYSAKINQNWETRTYPFDRHELTIIVESVGRDTSEVIFRPELKGSIINESIALKLWQLGKLKLEAAEYTYNSNFGEETAELAVYSRLLIGVPVSRIGLRIFITSFIGFIVSFFISVLLYFINPEDISSRLSLALAALFATVGNKYTIDTTLPLGSVFTLADVIAIFTFLVVIVSIFVSILLPWLIKKKNTGLARVINWTAFACTCPVYFIVVGYTILNH